MSGEADWIQAVRAMLRDGLAGPEAEYRALIFSPAYRSPKAGLQPGNKIPYQTKGRLDLKVAFLNDKAKVFLTSLCD